MFHDKPKLAWIAPLQVKNCTSSYVSEQFLPYLKKLFDVRVFADEMSFRSYPSSRYDFTIINIENHPNSLFTLSALRSCQSPSLVYVHDVFFDGQQLSLKDLDLHDAVFFSSMLDMRRYLGKLSGRVSYLPYPVQIEVPPVRARSLSSLEPLKILLFAEEGSEYRPEKLIAAIASQSRDCSTTWMVDPAEQSFFAPLCLRLKLKDVSFVGPRDFELWNRCCREADVIMLPKASALTDLGPVLALALASDARVVVSDFADAGELPDGVARKVPIGYREEEIFADEISKRVSRSTSNKSLALEFVREVHESGFLASQLLGFIRNTLKKQSLDKNSSLV